MRHTDATDGAYVVAAFVLHNDGTSQQRNVSHSYFIPRLLVKLKWALKTFNSDLKETTMALSTPTIDYLLGACSTNIGEPQEVKDVKGLRS